MESIIEKMKLLILAENPNSEGYSPATLAALRIDDEHYFKELHSMS